MSDLLSIGSSGVAAYQRALATVSNNIANVNTEGYTRQDVKLQSNQPRDLGNSFIGTGARFDAVRRQYDAFVESNLRNSNSELKGQEPLLSYVNRLIDVMGNESIGLTTAMNQFFASARDLASDPASVVARTTFLRDTDGLAGRFRQLDTQFNLLSTETLQSVESDVEQVNSLTMQLAQLNRQLAKKSHVDDQPSELLDQRDMLLRELSGLMAVKTKFADNGAVLVSVGDTLDQGILVRDESSRLISVVESTTDPDKLKFMIDAYGDPESLPSIASGKIGGVMNFRDQVLSLAIDSLDNLAKILVQEVNQVHRDGIDAEGQLGGDLLGFADAQSPSAGGMQVMIQDASRVAAAGQFRVIDDPLNPGSSQARITYNPASYAGPKGLSGDLANAQIPRIASVSLGIPAGQGFATVGLIQAGMRDVQLTLNSPGALQSLQVFSRDGRHLLGSDLGATAQGQTVLDRILKSSNGFEEGATYSDAVLNEAGNSADRYLDMDLFLGARAGVQEIQQFNPSTGALIQPIQMPAMLQGRAVASDWLDTISVAGRFTLNGQALAVPDPTAAAPADLAEWINGQNISGLTASMVDGALRISRNDTQSDIRLGLGDAGTPALLAKLGFDTSVHLQGSSQDDLLVFVADTTVSQASLLAPAMVTGQFASQSGDMKQMLRGQQIDISFSKGQVSAGENPNLLYYTIADTKSDTVLARRLFDTSSSGTPSIHYRGITLEFSTQPSANDVFHIDGNEDGIGNNETMLRLVALEEAQVMPGGLTLTEAYIERVNLVGSVARQASIAQEALKVVYEQAQEAWDGISGVSLDEEASALVRFQQAYQANAKVMQVASTLFDTVLQVR